MVHRTFAVQLVPRAVFMKMYMADSTLKCSSLVASPLSIAWSCTTSTGGGNEFISDER